MADLSKIVEAWGSERDKTFPMYTMHLAAFLQLTKVCKHEDLLESGDLWEFHEGMGRAMFVSHQWISRDHPDPNFQQLAVLQTALKGLLEGKTQVSLPPAVELGIGRVKCPTAADLRAEALYLWYDYFSCPQGTSIHAAENRQCAIDCIPSYVVQCFFFVILCPAVPHDDGHTLSQSSWEERGWCRLERMARELARDDGFVITVQTGNHLSLAWNMNGVVRAPGKGQFSFETDRSRVGQVILRMMWKKLDHLLANGELHHYRFLLNLHHLHFEGLTCVDPIEGLIPGFETTIDPVDDPGNFSVARFLHDNLFTNVTERDATGWSPLCFAVVKGDPDLVKALLQSRADPNDYLPKKKKHANLSTRMPVLSMAAAYHNCEVMKVLLAARAKLNAQCGYRGTALAWAAASDNAPAMRLLCEAKADPRIKVFPGASPFRVACGIGGVNAINEMLVHFPAVNLRYCLHYALVFSGTGDTVSCLIGARADVDEQLRVPPSRVVWWSLLKMLHMRHYTSPSALTYLAYHHYGATPLIFSILSGKLEATTILLKAGAKTDIRNDRGKSASDFLREMQGQTLPLSSREPSRICRDAEEIGSDEENVFSI